MNPAEENEVRRILEKKLCTQAQIAEAEGIQRQMEQMGLRPRSVPEVLLEKGYLDAEDLEEIQREETSVQGRNQIAGYEILELLGRGAMGAVYKAKQLSLDRVVALKVLDPELAQDASYVENFLTEARAVARLSHTNLISGIDVGDDEGVKYLVMEYADGITLSRLLRRGGALDEERALLLAMQVGRALDHAHKSDLVHGDVRPENVMITADGVTKLCDLGLARRPLIAGAEEGRSLRRTPDYISPEQARGVSDVPGTADLYGLGATLFHMLTGRVPFVADSREAVLAKHLTEMPPTVQSLAPETSEATEAIVARLLQKNPAERYASAAELVAALEQALAALQASRAGPARPAAVAGKGKARSGPTAPPAKPAAGAAPVVRRRRRRR